MVESGQMAEPPYKVDLVGITPKTVLYDGAFEINPTASIDQIEQTDLIIVTTIVGDFEAEIKRNSAFVHWIREQRIKHNAEVASLCTGAFLLAETGLLNGKSCATHWVAHDLFQKMYPQINLVPEKVISEDNGIYSSGGAYSFLNLLLYLVEKYSGRETAIWCSKLFEIEFDRDNQNQFMIFQGQKTHEDEAIKKAQVYIENNVGEKINVEKLTTVWFVP